jgi:hypothetical protein
MHSVFDIIKVTPTVFCVAGSHNDTMRVDIKDGVGVGWVRGATVMNVSCNVRQGRHGMSQPLLWPCAGVTQF